MESEMKLYHYVARPNNALTDGILSFAKNPNADLNYYIKRSGQATHAGIVQWMENCFFGRSRGIRLLIEPLQYTERTSNIKKLIESSDLFEVDVSSMARDGLIEAIYVSPSVLEKEPENLCLKHGFISATGSVPDKANHKITVFCHKLISTGYSKLWRTFQCFKGRKDMVI